MEIQIAGGVLLCAFDLFDQIEQQGEVGGPGILLKLVHLFQVKNLIVVAADMDEQQIPDPPAEPGQCLDATIGFGEALSQGQDRADRFKCRGGDDGQTFFLPFAQGGDIQREGFADPAFRDERQEPRIRRRQFALEDHGGFDLRARRRGEAELLAARADRDRERVGSAGDQEEERMSRRFLQRLEQRVGGADGHAVGFIDQADFPFAHEGAIDELLFDLPDLFDLDGGVGEFTVGIDRDEVRVRSRGDLQAGAAGAATVQSIRGRRLLAVQGLGKMDGRETFPDRFLAVEQIRMSQPVV